MKEPRFTVRYHVDDGYAGGSRPHSFVITSGMLNGDEDDEALDAIFDEELERAFREDCHPYSDGREAFRAWARAQIEEMSRDE